MKVAIAQFIFLYFLHAYLTIDNLQTGLIAGNTHFSINIY